MNWIWLSIRVAGLSGYFLLTLSLLAGMFSHVPRKRGNILAFHQMIGQIGLLFIGIHVCLLMFDSYMPYSVTSLLIPFTAPNYPILSGFGTIATYLFIIVVFTSDFMKVIGRSLWKKTHYLVFPMWLLAAIHGLFIGTDSQTVWAEVLYIGTTGAVILSTLVLILTKNRKQGNQGKHSNQRNQRDGSLASKA